MADPKTCGQDPAQIIQRLQDRVEELIQDAAKWQARAELRTFERDEARRAAENYRDGYCDIPGHEVLAENRFPWEASNDD